MVILNREFGNGTIKDVSHVRLYAKRYAERHGLPRKGEKTVGK